MPRPTVPHCRGEPIQELPESIRSIVNDSTARLLSWLRFGETKLDAAYIPAAIEALTLLEEAHVTLALPSTQGQVRHAIDIIAQTVMVELPEDLGLFAYAAILGDIPGHVLELAAIEILRTHTYRTMPLPAEFLKTRAVVEWGHATRWLPNMCASRKRELIQRQQQGDDNGTDRKGSGKNQSQLDDGAPRADARQKLLHRRGPDHKRH